jgi:hypothetical protein
MNEQFEFQILHLKGDYCPEDFPLASCSPSTSELSNPSQAAQKIPQTLNGSQLNFTIHQKSATTHLNRNFNLLKAERDSESHPFSRISRNMGGRLLTCDARPHSPWIKFLSRKAVVGSGLLVRYAAHIAGLVKTTSFIQTNVKTNSKTKVKTNNKNPRFQHFKHSIELFMYSAVFLETSFEKNLAPGNMFLLGTLGGTHE